VVDIPGNLLLVSLAKASWSSASLIVPLRSSSLPGVLGISAFHVLVKSGLVSDHSSTASISGLGVLVSMVVDVVEEFREGVKFGNSASRILVLRESDL